MALAIPTDTARLSRELGIDHDAVVRTVALLDNGNTVPFITRYRRDDTGGLDEEAIGRIRSGVSKLRLIEERKQTILRSIQSQNKLTDELQKEIERADSIKRLEDLYLPFRPKKQSLALKAREQGLGPLAEEILAQAPLCHDLDARAADFANSDKGVADAASALLGAGHILAEQFSEQPDVRQKVRKLYRKSGRLVSAKVSDDNKRNGQFADYLDFREPLGHIPPHRILAINRGEKENALKIKIDFDADLVRSAAVERLPLGCRHAGCHVRSLVPGLLFPVDSVSECKVHAKQDRRDPHQRMHFAPASGGDLEHHVRHEPAADAVGDRAGEWDQRQHEERGNAGGEVGEVDLPQPVAHQETDEDHRDSDDQLGAWHVEPINVKRDTDGGSRDEHDRQRQAQAAGADGDAHRDEKGEMVRTDHRMTEAGKQSLAEGRRQAAAHHVMRGGCPDSGEQTGKG